ncbi:polyprenyl synthetase family protein [Nakamurella sp. PAMC28650]|uniref:polyprenyl synthetase family protein n=1 Tax=Nakamurella sp. PAMC28650 TaxID=2762325 RepID=UPI00164D62B1|nr:polyprenyl synthetase family protein [Nakamurella sp. PAMC28650]QNK79634.1 polyprenyl synthetase family protein [Nakamurella sp. PAMC28650]
MHPSPSIGDPTAAVETVLSAELAARRIEVTAIDSRLSADVDRLIGYIRAGGKRLRPQFLCWGWVAAQETGGLTAPPPGVIKAAAALELIQACALLHDDIIDRSDTRRGRPSVHRSVQKLHADHGWSGDGEHYGLSSALLLGDLALAWADDLFADGLVELGHPAGALAAWRAMRTEVLAGQLLDLRISADESSDPEVAAADAMIVNRYKTAAYTVERPLHLGAALANGSPATIAALREYGKAIGIGFQLRDDLLGVFGDPAVTGKPAGGDLVEGKKTVLLAMARSALAQQPTLLAELDAGVGTALSPIRVEHLTQMVAGTTAPADIETRIDELLASGIGTLDLLDDTGRALISAGAREQLRRLALAATARDR